ncbi:MAG: hypothetical protein HN838_18465, partial [Rhodospirillaceae bacterium]|nr:hypothetical protein [Rhodospirillaceae bacterium]
YVYGGEGFAFGGEGANGGDVTLSGLIDTTGGDATLADNIAVGGDGGRVAIEGGEGYSFGFGDEIGGSVTLSGTINATGGYADASGSEGFAFGGDGGEGFVASDDGSVSVGGSIDTSGGDAVADYAYGGEGATIFVSGENGGGDYAAVSIDGTLTSLGGVADGVYNGNDGVGDAIFVIGGEGADGVAVSINGTISTDADAFGPPSVLIASTGGDVEFDENATVTADGYGGDVEVTAGKYGGSYDAIMDADAVITATNGDIEIYASNDVVLGQLTVGGGEGNSVYVGAEGSISSADSGGITNISTGDEGFVELYAYSGIGSDDEGYENVITLSADGGAGALELDAETYFGDINVDVDGDLYVSNYSVEITNFSSSYASSDDNISLSASGDINLGHVDNNGYGSVSLTAGGSILAAGGEGGSIEANGDVSLSGVGIGDDEDAINILGGEGSSLSLTASGGEGGEINVDAYDSGFDSLTITLEDADSDVYVLLQSSDFVTMSGDGVDVTLDDMRSTGSGIDVTINAEAGDADLVTAQGTSNLGGDLSLTSADDIVLGDGSGGVVINANGNDVSLSADGAISNANGGVINFGYEGSGSLVMSAGDGIGADGAVLVTGAEGSVNVAAEADGDIVIDSSGGTELTVAEIGDVSGISSASGDVTLAADDLEIGESVSGARVTLTTSDTERLIDLGGAGGEGGLSLTEAELGNVSSDVIQIGDDANDGGITVTDAVSFTDAGHDVAHLVTGGGDMSDDEASAVQVDNLAISSSDGTVTLDGDNQVGTLAVDHSGAEGSVTFNDFDGLEVGSVDGIDGISAYDVTLSTGGALTDDGVNNITAETLTVGGASSVGDIEAGLTVDASEVDITAGGNIVLDAVGEDGVLIAAAVVGDAGGIAIYSSSETVTLDGVSTEDGDILVGVDTSIEALNVSAGTAAAADGDIIMLALGDITVGDVSAGDDLIAIGADGNINFIGGDEGADVGGGNSTLTLAAGGDISFDGANFGSAADPIGTLNVVDAENFTIVSPFDVFTLDIGVFNVSGTVDLGDTLTVLGENAFTINAGDIFGALTAENAESVTILATGVIGEVNAELEVDNPFVATTTGALRFEATAGVINGAFGGGDVQGFAWLGALDGRTFLINGVTVVFEPQIDIEDVINSITTDTNVPDSEVDLSGPSALQSTSTFVADIFSVDFSLGTNLSVAPAAGGDGEGGEGAEDGGGDFLGNFWGSLIETAPDEDDGEDGDNTAGDDLFDDEDDVFGDEDDEDEEALNDE